MANGPLQAEHDHLTPTPPMIKEMQRRYDDCQTLRMWGERIRNGDEYKIEIVGENSRTKVVQFSITTLDRSELDG